MERVSAIVTISAVLGNNKAMRKADEMFISSSNWTERVGFVAAIETLKFIKKKIWININSTGKFIEKNWLKIFDKYKIKVFRKFLSINDI